MGGLPRSLVVGVRWRRRRRELGLRVLAVRPFRSTLFRWLTLLDDRGAAAFALPERARVWNDSHRVTLGRDVHLGDHMVLQLGPAGRLVVGDGVAFGPHVNIAADRRVEIGAGARIAPHAVITDTWTYGRSAAESSMPRPVPVRVGAGARVGARAVVGPGVVVADGAQVPPGAIWHADEMDGAL